MTRYFLGVDIGGTKSHALIADDTGQVVGFGMAGAGNPEIVGREGLAGTLHAVVREAIVSAGIAKEQITGAGFGVAGYDWPSQREPILEVIRALELSASMELVNDTIVGLLAGTPEGWGIAIVAGTRCNCWGWDRQRRIGRMTGCGVMMAEAAGGEELVGKAVQAVALEWTRRGPTTRLTQAFVEFTGARGVEDLLEGLFLQRYHLDASAAPLVFQVAAAGDEVAQELILWAGRELASLATGVIRQLNFEALSFDAVLVGSLYNGSPVLVETIQNTIRAVAPAVRFVRLATPPVVGAVLLGMEQAGFEPARLRPALIESTVACLQQTGEAITPLEKGH